MADHILTQDPTKPGVIKGNGPILASGNTVPLSGLDVTGANNGDAIVLAGGVWTPGTGGASSDTASNLGGGAQVFKSKVGADFQFRSLVQGSNITITQNANDITIASSGSSVFTTSFTSAPQALTAGGALTLAHGLGGSPTLLQGRLICIDADSGYSTNDEVITPLGGTDENNAVGAAVVPDATNLNVRYGNAVRVVSVLHKTTGAVAVIDITKWNFIFKAWR